MIKIISHSMLTLPNFERQEVHQPPHSTLLCSLNLILTNCGAATLADDVIFLRHIQKERRISYSAQ